MELDKLLENMFSERKRNNIEAEIFIMNLLKTHITNQGKAVFYGDADECRGYDMCAPEGFDNFTSSTYISFRLSINLNKVQTLFNSFYSRVRQDSNQKLVVITIKPVSALVFEEMKRCNSNGDTSIVIWGLDEIYEIARMHEGKVKELGNKRFELKLESIIGKKQEKWKDKRKSLIDSINGHYKDGQLSLFLGAGVSSSCGLPDWNTLLNSLMVSMLTKELNQHKKLENKEVSSIVERLRKVDEPSALMSARYIRKGMASSGSTEQTKFIEAVTEKLYGLRNENSPIDSALIKSIAAMCIPGRTGPKVKSVITYNFDDLLERELLKREIIHRSIFEEIEIPTQDELPLYHVHGYLPQDESKHSNLDKSTLVFSEEGYHKIYSEPYHWSNLVQLNNLKESTCIMIGLSMTDPNLRRLLEIASRSIEIPKHYAFIKRIDFDVFTKEESKNIVDAPSSTIKTFLNSHHSLNEDVLAELGVNVIWYESYDEIPSLLQDIYKSI